MPSPVVHFEIPVNDVDRLSKFYSDIFGWKFKKTPMGEGFDYWLITTGPRGRGIDGGMYSKQNMPQAKPVNYVQVNNIEAAIEKFKQAGGTIAVDKQEIPKIGWSAIGVDPEGNTVGLFQGLRPRRRRTSSRKAKRRR